MRISDCGLKKQSLLVLIRNPKSAFRNRLAPCDSHALWGEAHASPFAYAAVCEVALDELVAQEGEDAASQEERPAVAVPVHARGAAIVVHDPFGTRRELPHLLQVQRLVTQKKNGRRLLEKMLIAGPSRQAHGQTEQPRVR